MPGGAGGAGDTIPAAPTLVLVSERTPDQLSQNASVRQIPPGSVQSGNAGAASTPAANAITQALAVQAPGNPVNNAGRTGAPTEALAMPDADAAPARADSIANVAALAPAIASSEAQPNEQPNEQPNDEQSGEISGVMPGQSTPDAAEVTLEQGTTADSAAGQPLAAAAQAQTCTLVDSLRGDEQRDQFLALLLEENISAEMELHQEPVASTWWVHIPPFASEELAQRTLQELQGKSIDSYYMRSGELAGGISLGVFSRQESALVAQTGLERRGYRTEIREIFRMENRYRARIAASEDTLLAAPRVRLFLGANTALEVSQIVCESVAQATQFP